MSVLARLLAQGATETVALTLGGTSIMILSVGLVLGLNVFCMVRILREKRLQEHHHVPLDMDTQDLDD